MLIHRRHFVSCDPDDTCSEALVWQNYPVHVDVSASSENDATVGVSYASLLTNTASWTAGTTNTYTYEYIQV